MVPTILLTHSGIHLLVPGDDDVDLGRDDVAGLSAALARVSATHQVSGRVMLVPDSDVPHAKVIAAMDAARAPGFPYVTVAGGAS